MNNITLYNIFFEIKSKLMFDVFFAEQSDFYKKITNFDLENCIFLVQLKDKNKYQELISFNRAVFLNKEIIEIKKLIDKLNIHFLKIKFNLQSKISIKNYELNLNSRIIEKNKITLKLTEKETQLILFLFNSPYPIKVDQLQEQVWFQKSKLETHTVETHIYRLRKKLLNTFNDSSFILSDRKGYFI